MTRRSIGSIALMLGAAIACRSTPHRDEPSPLPDGKLTVRAPGAEPRRTFRYVLAPARAQTLRLELRTRSERRVNGDSVPDPAVPLVRFRIGAKVAPGRADGQFPILIHVEGADVPGDAPDPASPAARSRIVLDGLTGLSHTRNFTTRGPGDLSYPPASSRSESREMFTNLLDWTARLAVVLPEEAVGVGARWESTANVRQGDIQIAVQATYELVSVTGDELVVRVHLVETALPQDLGVVAPPPAPQARLESLQTDGEGELWLRLGSPFPHQAHMTLSSKVEMVVPEQQERTQLEISVTADLDSSPE